MPVDYRYRSTGSPSSDRLRPKMSARINLYHDEFESNLYALFYERILFEPKDLNQITGKVLTVLAEMIKLAK
jgi:hypothetical protein